MRALPRLDVRAVVDDEERMVDALRRGMTARRFRGGEAPDGVRGGPAQTATSTPWSSTLMLPGLSGYEVVARLRAAETVAGLMLSAKGGEYDQATR